jgi:hypothetical protein
MMREKYLHSAFLNFSKFFFCVLPAMPIVHEGGGSSIAVDIALKRASEAHAYRILPHSRHISCA